MEYAVQMRNITKTFGEVTANKAVSLDIMKGEILALLGEMAAVKPLMNMLSVYTFPMRADIHRRQEAPYVHLRTPMSLVFGMIHQHFKLVDVFTAAENIVLGIRKKEGLTERPLRLVRDLQPLWL